MAESTFISMTDVSGGRRGLPAEPFSSAMPSVRKRRLSSKVTRTCLSSRSYMASLSLHMTAAGRRSGRERKQ